MGMLGTAGPLASEATSASVVVAGLLVHDERLAYLRRRNLSRLSCLSSEYTLVQQRTVGIVA